MRVLVVGAGIAGLSTARALGQVGIECDVVEREPAWTRDGTGIYLPANAIGALRLLGIDSSSRHKGAVIPRQRFLDHRGRVLLDVDLANVWGNDDPCVAMSRATLHETLRDCLTESIRMVTTVASLRTVEDQVEVAFDDDTTLRYDLVVGADGIRSGTRRLMLGGADEEVVRPVGQMAWRFVTECPPQVTTWTVMLGRGSTFLTIPIGTGRVYCYADTAVERDGSDSLARYFAGFAEPVSAILATLDPATVHRVPVEEVGLQDWIFGRVVIIGDAAHATSPNMAQGAAMAMEDALVLARCLTASPDVDAALAEFQRRRRPRTDWVREQTHRRDHTRNLPPVIRDAALRLAGRRIFRSNYAPLVQPP